MKVVVSSDWHPDVTTHGVPRFREVKEAVHHTVDVAIEEGAGLYLFAGDLCDPDAGSVVFRCVELALEVAARLAEANILSAWIAGNHDVIEDGSGDTTLSPLRALALMTDRVKLYEKPGALRTKQLRAERNEDVSVIALPFTATSHGYDVESAIRELKAGTGTRESTVVVAHLNVPGVVPGEETTDMPRGREIVLPVELAREHAKYVINGHYHRQQLTESGVWIPGSVARFTFGEEGHQPSFLVLRDL